MEEMSTILLGELLSDDRGISVGVMYPGDDTPLGIPMVRVADIIDATISRKVNYRISPEVNYQYRRTELVGGECLMTLVGRPGIAVKVPKEMKGWNVARALAVLRLKDLGDVDYFIHAIASPQVQHTIRNWCNTTVQATLNLKEIKALPLPWPDKAQRREIAATLGALNEKIELNRRMNETLEEMARALFRDWFVDFGPTRAKMAGQAPYLFPALWDLFPASLDNEGKPEGWNIVQLGQVAAITKGRSYKSTELQPSETALVTLKSFARGGGYRSDGLKPFTGSYKPNQEVQEGDVVVALTDVTQAAELIGRPARIATDESFKHLVASLDVAVIRAAENSYVGREFLFGRMATEEFTTHTFSHTSGTTVLHLSKDGIPSFSFALPPPNAVRAYEDFAAALHNRIQANTLVTKTLTQTRDLVLPRLMSGELRVADFDPAKEETAA